MKQSIFDARTGGVLLHLSSVPGAFGVGDLGSGAHDALDWIARTGLTWWQMLPVGPIGPGDSPYASTSSFAGEPLFISIDGLVRDRLLPRSALRAAPALSRGSSRYAVARSAKWPRFEQAFEAFRRKGGLRSSSFKAFERRQRFWLPGWRAFMRDEQGLHAFLQFAFDAQWSELKQAAAAKGIRLLGDVPIFVSLDSADVQSNPSLFRLDRHGRPTVVTGVPPDCFSADGQLWGHPHYRWSEHRRTGYRWWIERVRAAVERFDAVRIDHFIGFFHAYEIPGSATTAREGTWKRAPGRELLGAIERAIGSLPLIAEDLGALTPPVVALRDDFGLPGMKLLHNAFYGDDSGEAPHRHPRHCVCYPGTHDNDTTVGWWQQLQPAAKARARAYMGWDGSDPAAQLNRLAFTSPANTAIVAMQDALGLGAEARMNLPGTASGNWHWRLQSRGAASLRSDAADRLKALAVLTGRARAGAR
jgi:4-alpha-glucanotransferase